MRPVHVVILAAGRGKRMGAHGEEVPKWLLEVRGRSIADRQLEAIDRAGDAIGSVRVVTGHAPDALQRFLDERGADGVEPVHNPDYARWNNWYSVLLALRSIEDPDPCVAIVNCDLYAEPGWYAGFLMDCARTKHESLIGVDLERPLTDESMKVSVNPDSTLRAVGKVGVEDPAGEYVGLLMAAGPVLEDFRAALEGFVGEADRVNEWYERAVGLTAAGGTPWTIWPTPDSRWVEIDDGNDLELAERL